MENLNYGPNTGVVAGTIYGNVSVNNIAEKKKFLPSLLPKFIERLSDLVYDEPPAETIELPLTPYDIVDKITYNNLRDYSDIVDDYGSYYTICTSALNSIDDTDYGIKERILNLISEIYKTKKREVITEFPGEALPLMDIIRRNSDRIIELIKEDLKSKIRNYYTNERIYEEDLDFCSNIFLCYSFVECKVLEKVVRT